MAAKRTGRKSKGTKSQAPSAGPAKGTTTRTAKKKKTASKRKSALNQDAAVIKELVAQKEPEVIKNAAPEKNSSSKAPAIQLKPYLTAPMVSFKPFLPVHAYTWWLHMARTWATETERIQQTAAQGYSNVLTSSQWVTVESLGLLGIISSAINNNIAAQLQRNLHMVDAALPR